MDEGEVTEPLAMIVQTAEIPDEKVEHYLRWDKVWLYDELECMPPHMRIVRVWVPVVKLNGRRATVEFLDEEWTVELPFHVTVRNSASTFPR